VATKFAWLKQELDKKRAEIEEEIKQRYQQKLKELDSAGSAIHKKIVDTELVVNYLNIFSYCDDALCTEPYSLISSSDNVLNI
jgi:Skp family chaperone for outer membrane proteins